VTIAAEAMNGTREWIISCNNKNEKLINALPLLLSDALEIIVCTTAVETIMCPSTVENEKGIGSLSESAFVKGELHQIMTVMRVTCAGTSIEEPPKPST